MGILNGYVSLPEGKSGLHDIFHGISDLQEVDQNISLQEQLGYDRPSAKFLCFLKKHYGLCKYKARPGRRSSGSFTPNLGEMIQFDDMFQMGGSTSNHQLEVVPDA